MGLFYVTAPYPLESQGDSTLAQAGIRRRMGSLRGAVLRRANGFFLTPPEHHT